MPKLYGNFEFDSPKGINFTIFAAFYEGNKAYVFQGAITQTTPGLRQIKSAIAYVEYTTIDQLQGILDFTGNWGPQDQLTAFVYPSNGTKLVSSFYVDTMVPINFSGNGYWSIITIEVDDAKALAEGRTLDIKALIKKANEENVEREEKEDSKE
ncbi:hypothetical protein SISNIDRAFT_465234 [Sistotremastrum niveocremeum HHB9708]|uniref:Uncharacterized protein n=1 Tax=Sistotremastrum niveocremeum HHB9708 TaxID=1314777 RepID=A0A164WFE2_9AGAM|nr:hypothetical protein SISNIDRAFT_465234 [Sistotremastrum niveocremeum HHB9708]